MMSSLILIKCEITYNLQRMWIMFTCILIDNCY